MTRHARWQLRLAGSMILFAADASAMGGIVHIAIEPDIVIRQGSDGIATAGPFFGEAYRPIVTFNYGDNNTIFFAMNAGTAPGVDAGVLINASSNFRGGTYVCYPPTWQNSSDHKYFPLHFSDDGGAHYHYGWIEMTEEFPTTGGVVLRFVDAAYNDVADEGLIAGVLSIPASPLCGSSDFNADGDFGTDQDIEDFFRCLTGNCCATCFGPDFNGDGDAGTDADIEAFFRVLAGGAC